MIDSIQAHNKKFLRAECFELLGDIQASDQNKNYDEALRLYALSIHSKPDNIEVYIKQGRTYEKMREYDEAISHYMKATRRDKKNFTAFYRQGLCQIRNNQRVEGI